MSAPVSHAHRLKVTDEEYNRLINNQRELRRLVVEALEYKIDACARTLADWSLGTIHDDGRTYEAGLYQFYADLGWNMSRAVSVDAFCDYLVGQTRRRLEHLDRFGGSGYPIRPDKRVEVRLYIDAGRHMVKIRLVDN